MENTTTERPKDARDILKSQLQINQSLLNFIDNETILRREAIEKLINPGKDIDFECGYPDPISTSDYKKMYKREGIAKKVVKMLPEDSWSEPPMIYEQEESEETEFESAWKDLQQKKHVFQYLQRVDILSGIGRFGLLLLGLSDGKKLAEPVDGIDERTGEKVGNAKHELLYLKVFDESVVSVVTTENDVTSPRYGQPTMYNIQFEASGGNSNVSKLTSVHWTRVIHIADNRESSEVYGTPRMESVYNRLLDIRKVLSGSGEMFWKGGFPGYTAELDPTMAPAIMQNNLLKDDIEESLKEQVELWQSSLQRILAVAGMKFKSLQPQVSDPDGHVTTHLKAIAISMNVPYRIFIGTEEAKLASSQDIKTYNKRLDNRQNQYITPLIIRPTIDRFIIFGILPEPKEYFVTWPEMDALSETEQTQIIKDKTEALAKYVTGGVNEVIPEIYYLTEFLDIDPDLADEILKERDLQEPPLEEQPEDDDMKDKNSDNDDEDEDE